MKMLCPRITEGGHSVDRLNTMSLKQLSRVSGVPRATLHYRINTMHLPREKAIVHEKNKWINFRRSEEEQT